jgi:hypothetical protein|tara:strand:+ start:851 stop:1288 length:438 start_codon:yes stop_codon:yes gene_type:complete
MADFIIKIQEQISLNGVQRGSEVSKTISGINYTDNRILNTSSGSETTIFSLSDTVGAGQFLTSSLKYARVSNNSTTVPVNLKVSSSTEQLNFKIDAGGSFMLSTSNITGSILSGSDAVFTYGDIASLKVEPSGSSAKVEYIIATT